MTLALSRRRLANGLDVVVHEDRSDPVVAVVIAYHVGSARESHGRTGLAHLFEHLMFEGSANVKPGEHFERVQAAGGTLNGTTSFDRTWYYETLPSQHLELALWLEADRMGGLAAALSQAKLDNQRDVVKNERRQSYENRPYGLVREALAAELFPAGHPYSWLPIGSMADLDAATLADVRGFFERWYGPNNATLVIAGDVEAARAFELAEQHFGWIPRGPEVLAPRAWPVRTALERRSILEDRVQLPQVVLGWPAPARLDRDAAALSLAAMVLSQNKSSVLDRALTVERLLASSVGVSFEDLDSAGQFVLSITAAPGVELAQLEGLTRELIARTAREGVDPAQLERMRTRYEADFLWRLETVSGKAALLSEHLTLGGEPLGGFAELERMRATEPEEVRAAIERWLVEQPPFVLSVVPLGRSELASRSTSTGTAARETSARTSLAPAPGPRPRFSLPEPWRHDVGALSIWGVRTGELPVSAWSLALPAGARRFEPLEQSGRNVLLSTLLGEGTARFSTLELQDELDRLGASLDCQAGDDELVLRASALDREFEPTLALFGELLAAPRLAPEDFERERERQSIAFDTRADRIRWIAAHAFARLVHGEAAILGQPAIGSRATLAALSRADLAESFARFKRGGARLIVASQLDPERVVELCTPLAREITCATSTPVAEPETAAHTGRRVYWIDKPGAAQSEVCIGHRGVAATDPDWFPLAVLNYVLGGAFTSRLNRNLREDKGYTYGAHSAFDGGSTAGSFCATSAVHTQTTAVAVREMLKEVEGLVDGIAGAELALARAALSQSLQRQFEPLGARLGLADNIAKYGWPSDYPLRRLELLDRLTCEDLVLLARRHIRPSDLFVLVVGDGAKLGDSLGQIGWGEPIELDVDGRVRGRVRAPTPA